MHKKGTFAVKLLGLTESERRVVKSLCMLSCSRTRSYKVLSPTEGIEADVWIVDGRDQTAMDALRVEQSGRRVPAIVIDAATESAAEGSHMGRPIVASRLLSALDHLVTKAWDYYPELVIGGNGGEESHSAPVGGNPGGTLHPGSLSRGHTALVVDDSVTIRKQVELALRLHKVDAVCADSGESALALLATRQFDLIFLDVVLPGGTDGYQICRSIKKNSHHKNTPVIMLTGKSSPFDRVRGSLAGCDTYLTKPVENHTFNAVLQKYLKPGVSRWPSELGLGLR